MTLGKYSFGHGDRFGQEGEAQLRAIVAAKQAGVEITPVWNKSYREHQTIGSHPEDVRREADAAVAALGWEGAYFVDADHVTGQTVDWFVESSDFFTIDVAEAIGQPAPEKDVEAFVSSHRRFLGTLAIPGIAEALQVSEADLRATARRYLFAVQEAGRIYRKIAARKQGAEFVVEVSMDETEASQTPRELLFILSALAAEEVPVATIAPKFTGRFNKGVDYVGNLETFAREFEADLAVVRFAVAEFDLPPVLKLSVHSGSDKFSLYPIIRRLIRRHDAGLHLKTAGTTWLEELIGLAESGEEGAALVIEIYRGTLEQFAELTRPYATVLDIDEKQLPAPDEVARWSPERLVRALRHNQEDELYNPHFRQALHVGYKIAAAMGSRFTDALNRFKEIVQRNVTDNLLERHIRPLFLEK